MKFVKEFLIFVSLSAFSAMLLLAFHTQSTAGQCHSAAASSVDGAGQLRDVSFSRLQAPAVKCPRAAPQAYKLWCYSAAAFSVCQSGYHLRYIPSPPAHLGVSMSIHMLFSPKW